MVGEDIKKLTEENFSEEIKQGVTLVDFYADWCGPCKVMAPQFAAAAKRLPHVRFAKVDSDSAPSASGRFGIRSIPTLILFHGGRERARMSGAVSANQLVQWVHSNLPESAR